MLHLQIIIASTRPGRVGGVITDWFRAVAEQHGKFDIEVVDLAEVNLPMFDEPRHPRFGNYEHDHTKAWSESVKRADAYIVVTPEYNHGSPPALINAFDFVSREWAYKPMGFVSYGGVSAGTRSVQMTKTFVTALKMMPMMEAVNIPFFSQYLNSETGAFEPPEPQAQAAVVMLDELLKWAEAMKPMRG